MRDNARLISNDRKPADGGAVISQALTERGVQHLFTLCGGHISPILVGARRRGITVVDLRDERSAVFAADAAARITGNVGVAAVTAGPGVTNTVTAVKNAQLAETPLLILGGAAATVLKGRGSLQDIDQLSLMRPITKWATAITARSALAPTLHRAIDLASRGVPGPVFVEVPVDLLYPEEIVRQWYLGESGVQKPRGLAARALGLYLRAHLLRQFHGPSPAQIRSSFADFARGKGPARFEASGPRTAGDGSRLNKVHGWLRSADRPVLVVGSQAVSQCRDPETLAAAIVKLGLPTYLAGSARGLLGHRAANQLLHKRSSALRDADVVLVAGFPFDFRLNYGRVFNPSAKLIAINLSRTALNKNRKPTLAIQQHPGSFLEALAATVEHPLGPWRSWFDTLRQRELAREAEIDGMADENDGEWVNPVRFLRELEHALEDDALLVVDGGDFVATASYALRPRAPLCWLDPGVFGTLGVGGGFTVGAAVCRPDKQVWLLYGDGSSAYSLAEFDTYVRHGLHPIAIVGTDGVWAQIARDQTEILGDDVGTVLRRTAYHLVAEGYGGMGLLVEKNDEIRPAIEHAQKLAAEGKPVLINVMLNRSDFRRGSLSM